MSYLAAAREEVIQVPGWWIGDRPLLAWYRCLAADSDDSTHRRIHSVEPPSLRPQAIRGGDWVLVEL